MPIKKDNFFKLIFLATLLLMLAVFASNLERPLRPPVYKQHGLNLVFETIDAEKIRKLIRENKLSNKECLFYRQIE